MNLHWHTLTPRVHSLSQDPLSVLWILWVWICLIQSSFTALKILCAPHTHSPLSLPSSNQWSFYFFPSFVFSRLSYSWNHTVCSPIRLVLSLNNSFYFYGKSFLLVFSQSFSLLVYTVYNTLQLKEKSLLQAYKSTVIKCFFFSFGKRKANIYWVLKSRNPSIFDFSHSTTCVNCSSRAGM